MSRQPHRQQRRTGRQARPTVPWSLWEIALLLISVVMIASPLLAAGWALIAPSAVLSQRGDPTPTPCPGGPCPPPTITVEPTEEPPPPTDTPVSSPEPSVSPTLPPAGCGQTGYDPCTPTPTCDPTGYNAEPCPSPTQPPQPTNTPAPTQPPQPTNTPAPTQPPQPTNTPAPTQPSQPTTPPTGALRASKTALGTDGQPLATVRSGDEFLYLIQVEHDVSSATPVAVVDDFAATIEGVDVVQVDPGQCAISKYTLHCAVLPAQGKAARIVVRVRVVGPLGAEIPNMIRVQVAGTDKSITASSQTLKISASTMPAPTAVPTAAPPAPQPAPPAPRPAPPAPQPAPPAPQPAPPAPTAAPPAPTEAPPAPTAAPPAPTAVPTEAPPAPTAAPPAPTQAPTARPPQRPRPTATPVPPRRQEARQSAPTAAPPAPTQPPAPTPTLGPTMPPVTTPEAERPSLRFNLSSDWGQVFVGDTVTFVVTLQNAGNEAGGSSPLRARARSAKLEARQAAPPVHDVLISQQLNPNFELLEASGPGLSVTTTGQKIEARRETLAGGETVELTIKARARDVGAAPLTTVNQAQLIYRDAEHPLFSNVVDVVIMPKALPTATPVPTAPPTPTTEPLLTAAGGAPVITPPQELGESLPQTSGGTPLAGVVLLGLTLLLHSIRVHRARVRI